MNRLRDVREDFDFTQKEIAEKLHIQQTHYSRYELGKQMMGIDKYMALSLFYNISIDYLCGMIDTPRTLTGISYNENLQMKKKKQRDSE
ncbi:MAG: helix-turn-helix transcriptional regulator [Clostridia bacterium]|nr:helix-turn-helix transcriptional regulator [Clostridia bacterium]